VIPYIFSILELGISTARGAFFTKKVNADSKYAFVVPRHTNDAGSTPQIGVVEGTETAKPSRAEMFSGAGVVAEVDVGLVGEGQQFLGLGSPFNVEVAC